MKLSRLYRIKSTTAYNQHNFRSTSRSSLFSTLKDSLYLSRFDDKKEQAQAPRICLASHRSLSIAHVNYDINKFWSTSSNNSTVCHGNRKLLPNTTIRIFSTSGLSSKTPQQSHHTPDDDLRREQMKKIGRKGAKLARKGAFSAKDLIKKYGVYFIGTYATVYVISVSSFFVLIDTGVIDPTIVINMPLFGGGGEAEAAAEAGGGAVTMPNGDEMEMSDESETVHEVAHVVSDLLRKWEWMSPYADIVEKSPKLTTLGVAWICTKVIEPVRVAVAFPLTPRVARFFGKKIDEDDDTH